MEYYESINPYNNESLAKKAIDEESALEEKILKGSRLNPYSAAYDLKLRLRAISRLSELLSAQKESLAELISREVGKPIKESRAEIDKCAWLCEYYVAESPAVLAEIKLELEDAVAFRRHEALGLLLGIMPWNFPFWQVFRFAVPSILAGNRILLKHAPNCVLSAQALNNLFIQCGLPEGAYQATYLSNEQAEQVLKDPRVKGLSLTGSTVAGRTVAQIAAANLKPQLLELGGSNAFILHESADPKKAAKLAASARLLNAGQSCIAAKRFFVPSSLEDAFLEHLEAAFRTYQLGDPLDETTDIGPLARPRFKSLAKEQVERSLAMGAKLVYGSMGDGNFVHPTILSRLNTQMPVFTEEVFAPIASVFVYKDFEEAITLSNQSPFGLGVSLIGEDVGFLMSQAGKFEEGAVFVNELVKSDPRLPFGGVKSSGYGRELGPEGLISFTNLKTIYRKDKLQ